MIWRDPQADTDAQFVLGVDGGNSKTIALIARADGTVLGAGRAGCSDIYGAASEEAALGEIERAVGVAAEQAGIDTGDVSCGAFSLAGADWPEDIELLTAELRQLGFGRHVAVMNDAFGALRAGSPDGTGIAVVCGTGAAIGARGHDGRCWQTSWWQEPQGSRQLAEKALRAICRSALGIEPPTAMTEQALALFGRGSVEELLHGLTRRDGSDRARATRLTGVLLAEAERGDPAARKIIEDHGASLGDFALAAGRQAGLCGSRFRLVLAGGVFRAGVDVLRHSLCERVLASEPGAEPVISPYEPAVGATLLALDGAGVQVDGTVMSRLDASLPPPELFATLP